MNLNTKGQTLVFTFAERFSKSFAAATDSQRSAWLSEAEELERVVVPSTDSVTRREEVLELGTDSFVVSQ